MGAVTNTLRERSCRALEWPKIKEKLAELATSELGKELCLELPLSDDKATIVAGLQITTECKELLEEENLPLEGIHDLKGILERVSKEAILDFQDLLAVRDTLRTGLRLKFFFQQRRINNPLLYKLTQPLFDLKEVEKTISRCFDSVGNLSDEASPQLRYLHRQVRSLHQKIKDQLNTILNSPSYTQVLQEHYYTMRANRYVIPVKAEARSRVTGIVHDSSLSGATVFIEPQSLVDLNNQLKMAELELECEIHRLLRELSSLVADFAFEISSNLRILGQVDLVYSKARLSQALDACAPRVNVQNRVKLLEVRHPLLALNQKEVVPNTICLGQEFQAMIITGPNAGGKTIALKAFGLCALMIRAGLHLPVAPHSEIALFSGIYADIGDQQSIEGSLSTFSAHLLNINEILQHAGSGTLVLLDEIAASTDPQEGASLAQAILERLIDQGSSALATTHYGQLKTLAIQDSRFTNAGMEFHMIDLRPTYSLLLGVPGRSFGMEIAHRLGLPLEAYNRVKELQGSKQTSLDALLEDLEKHRSALLDEQKLLGKLKEEAESLRWEYKKKLAKLRKEKEKTLTRSLEEITSLVSNAKKQIEFISGEAKSKRHLESLREARKSLNKLENQVRQKVRETRKTLYPASEVTEKNPLPCSLGETVEIISLGQRGILLDDPAQTNRVRVQVGQVKIAVERDDLQPWRGQVVPPRFPKTVKETRFTQKKESEVPRASTDIGFHLPQQENTCNLTGLRTDEALEQAEKYLDHAMLHNLPYVYFVHGHGTGALKNSLRGYLENSPYVHQFRPGQPEEGGDGVTLVELRG